MKLVCLRELQYLAHLWWIRFGISIVVVILHAVKKRIDETIYKKTIGFMFQSSTLRSPLELCEPIQPLGNLILKEKVN